MERPDGTNIFGLVQFAIVCGHLSIIEGLRATCRSDLLQLAKGSLLKALGQPVEVTFYSLP